MSGVNINTIQTCMNIIRICLASHRLQIKPLKDLIMGGVKSDLECISIDGSSIGKEC